MNNEKSNCAKGNLLMRKFLIFALGILILFMPNCGSLAESQDAVQAILQGTVPCEIASIDMGSNEPMSSYAQWRGADLKTVLNILAQLNVIPRWPSMFPEGFDPDQEPLIILSVRRNNDDFSESRIGDVLLFDEQNGERREYWRVDESLFNNPHEVSFYFSNDAKDAYFLLRYVLWTPKRIAEHGAVLSRLVEVYDSVTIIDASDFAPSKQIYLLDAKDAQSIRNGNRSDEYLMIFYRLMSQKLELEILREISINLVPYEEMLGII